jgi:hypothetical protein
MIGIEVPQADPTLCRIPCVSRHVGYETVWTPQLTDARRKTLDQRRSAELRRARKLLLIPWLPGGLRPMDFLILGGTALLGRAITLAAVDRGHAVTCLARGSSSSPEGAAFISADRNEDDGLAPVATRS